MPSGKDIKIIMMRSMKSKTTAGILAFFLGGLGVHKFYLNRSAIGILYLLFFWTFIPAFLGFFDMVVLFCMTQERFDRLYN